MRTAEAQSSDYESGNTERIAGWRVTVERRTGMLHSLHKRLRKLESRVATDLDKEKEFGVYFQLFLLDAFGYYFGAQKASKSSEAETARALGDEHEGHFNEQGTDPKVAEKYARANCRLFAKFGVDVGNANGQAIADSAKRIYAGLPVSYKSDTPVKPIHDNIWQCRPLDQVGRISRKSCVFTRDLQRYFDCVPWGRQFIEFIDENGRGPGSLCLRRRHQKKGRPAKED